MLECYVVYYQHKEVIGSPLFICLLEGAIVSEITQKTTGRIITKPIGMMWYETGKKPYNCGGDPSCFIYLFFLLLFSLFSQEIIHGKDFEN